MINKIWWRAGIGTIAAGLIAGVGLAPAAQAASPATSSGARLVHWQGNYFSVWKPTRNWQVVESANSLDVSSPTGLATVSFAYATNGPAPYDLIAVRNALLSPNAGITGIRSERTGGVSATGGGGLSQTTNFVAIRIRDHRLVRGVMTCQVFNTAPFGPYAVAAYERAAPKRQWSKWAGTLKRVQDRITFYGRG